MSEWKVQWGYEIATTATRPGIWRMKAGGYLVRGRVTDPRTSKRHQVMRVLHGASLKEAVRTFDAEMEEARGRLQGKTQTRTRFSDYAVSLLESKVLRNEIESKATRERWENALKHYLIPAFGAFWISELRHQDVEDWKDKVAGWMKRGTINPKTKKKFFPKAPTVNGWLRILSTICRAASKTYKFDNPFDGIGFFPEGRIYTTEDPNSVAVARVGEFLHYAETLVPLHYPMILLGLVTGLRPSSLRPIRRCGPNADLNWETGRLDVRRSHSRGHEIMNQTKTKKDGVIFLPEEVLVVLRKHVEGLFPIQAKTEFLFPSADGGLRSQTVLQKPFAKIRDAMKLPRLTPRSMRRTFQDATRLTGTSDRVTRSISGHTTEEMQTHYSTIQQDEQKEAISRVLRLAKTETKGVKKGVTE